MSSVFYFFVGSLLRNCCKNPRQINYKQQINSMYDIALVECSQFLPYMRRVQGHMHNISRTHRDSCYC